MLIGHFCHTLALRCFFPHSLDLSFATYITLSFTAGNTQGSFQFQSFTIFLLKENCNFQTFFEPQHKLHQKNPNSTAHKQKYSKNIFLIKNKFELTINLVSTTLMPVQLKTTLTQELKKEKKTQFTSSAFFHFQRQSAAIQWKII